MKTMLYITKLISSANKDICIYMALEDFQKYAFTRKEEFLYPYEDKNLLNVLNNVDGKMYEENSETKKNKKNPRSLKEKIQKTLSILGIATTIITLEPAALELVSYSLKKVNSLSHTSFIDENTDADDYLKQFSIAINKNEDYTDKERKKIIQGFKDYINDWGYILNETDKEYILHMIENVTVDRSSWMPKWAGGDYALGTINIKEENDYLDVVTHETCHLLSDRGLLVGSINGYGFGYALNEGINTSVNTKYYTKDKAYGAQVKDIMKLSLLVDNEVLIKAYQKKGPTYVASEIAKTIPEITYLDAIKYISMMDIELFIDGYKILEDYRLSKEFYEEKDALYDKMFKAKYGYDYSETVMAESSIKSQSFLEEEIIIKKENDLNVRYYTIPKNLLANKDESFDHENYLTGEYLTLRYNDAIKILATRAEIGEYESLDEFIKDFAKQYSDDEEELNKAKSVFTEELTDKNFDDYMRYALDKILSNNKSPEYTACYLKLLYKSVKEASDITDLKEKFDKKINETLEKNAMFEVSDLYHNSDISFKNEAAYSLDELELPEEYRKIEKTDNYIITEEGVLIVNIPPEQSYWSAKYDEQAIHLEEPDESGIAYCQENFDYADGKYYYTNIYRDLNTDEIDKEKINISVTTVVKVKESEKQSTK